MILGGRTRSREISRPSGTYAWSSGLRQIRELGKGTYGTVWLASKGEKLVAVKELVLRRGANDVESLENEIHIMQKLRGHDNVLTLYEYYRSNTTVQLVLQYCEGGEVLDAVIRRRGITENEAKVIMRQTFEAIRHCHNMNVCHRDLKPQNLLLQHRLSPGQQINLKTTKVVLCDFGVSCIISSDRRLRRLIGTVSYMAPEVFHRNYSIKCDLWSLGVIMFQLLSGFKPFENRRDVEIDAETALRRAFQKYHKFWNGRVSAHCRSLIKRLLQVNAKARPSCKHVLTLDPWFQKMDRDDRNIYDSVALKALCSAQKVTRFQHQMAISLADHIMKHHHTSKRDHEGELLRQFRMLDLNGDGVISARELQHFFKNSKYENTVAELISRCDLDRDEKISYREVLVCALERLSWNLPLRREDLRNQVGLSSTQVEDVVSHLQQRTPPSPPAQLSNKKSRRSPSYRTPEVVNSNIQEAARRSSRRKQRLFSKTKQTRRPQKPPPPPPQQQQQQQEMIEHAAQRVLREASNLLESYEKAEKSHRLGRHRATLMRTSKIISQQCRNLMKYRHHLTPALYNRISKTMNQISRLF